MTFIGKAKSIIVVRLDGTTSTYTYRVWTRGVGAIRAADAALINSGGAYAIYAHNPSLRFTFARFYPNSHKWYLKSNRSR